MKNLFEESSAKKSSREKCALVEALAQSLNIEKIKIRKCQLGYLARDHSQYKLGKTNCFTAYFVYVVTFLSERYQMFQFSADFDRHISCKTSRRKTKNCLKPSNITKSKDPNDLPPLVFKLTLKSLKRSHYELVRKMNRLMKTFPLNGKLGLKRQFVKEKNHR